MATTNLIVDFLVIGAAAAWWIVPILIAAIDVQWLRSASQIGAGTIPLLLGAMYILGLIVSRLADDVLQHWNRKWRDEVFGVDPEVTYHNMVNVVIASSESASEYLSYRRSVVRISRACAFNLGLGSVGWVLAGALGPVPLGLVAVLVVVSIIGAALLLRTWLVVLKGYFRIVRDMYGGVVERTR